MIMKVYFVGIVVSCRPRRRVITANRNFLAEWNRNKR
jgi:hypothetical protein